MIERERHGTRRPRHGGRASPRKRDPSSGIVPVSDTAIQTKAVMVALADEDRSEPDMSQWTALQVWLGEGDCQVTVRSSARRLREPDPASRSSFCDVTSPQSSVSFAPMPCCIEQPVVDMRGRMVGHGRGLRDRAGAGRGSAVGSHGEDCFGPGYPRRSDAVQALASQHEGGVPFDHSAPSSTSIEDSVSRRVGVAIEQGYLRNLEAREGKPAKLVCGDPLPTTWESSYRVPGLGRPLRRCSRIRGG